MHTLKLLGLHCHVPDEADMDEVYLKMKGDKIWPISEKYQQLQLGETLLDISIEDLDQEDIVEIELWDHDSLSRDDNLGLFILHLDQSGRFQTEIKKQSGSRASYSLDWEYY